MCLYITQYDHCSNECSEYSSAEDHLLVGAETVGRLGVILRFRVLPALVSSQIPKLPPLLL